MILAEEIAQRAKKKFLECDEECKTLSSKITRFFKSIEDYYVEDLKSLKIALSQRPGLLSIAEDSTMSQDSQLALRAQRINLNQTPRSSDLLSKSTMSSTDAVKGAELWRQCGHRVDWFENTPSCEGDLLKIDFVNAFINFLRIHFNARERDTALTLIDEPSASSSQQLSSGSGSEVGGGELKNNDNNNNSAVSRVSESRSSDDINTDQLKDVSTLWLYRLFDEKAFPFEKPPETEFCVHMRSLFSNKFSRLVELLDLHSSVAKYCICKSENHPWVVPSDEIGYKLKPDLFLVHESAKIGLEKNSMENKGVWDLRDAVHCFFEAKLKINLNEDLHQCWQVAHSVISRKQYDNRPPVTIKYVLFDCKQFYLFRFCFDGSTQYDLGPQLVDSFRFAWNTAGSYLALMSFMYPITPSGWVETLDYVLAHRGLKLIAQPKFESETTAFLGMGAEGRVFRVADEKEQIYALKIVRYNSTDKDELVLEDLEFSTKFKKTLTTTEFLSKRYHPHSQLVLNGERIVHMNADVPVGSALLMSPVGLSAWDVKCYIISTYSASVNKMNNLLKSLFHRVMQALYHLHRAGVQHGDARLPNLLLNIDNSLLDTNILKFFKSTEFFWIDFRSTSREEDYRMISDCHQILRSFFLHDRPSSYSQFQSVSNKSVSNYFNLVSSETIELFPESWCDQVWKDFNIDFQNLK